MIILKSQFEIEICSPASVPTFNESDLTNLNINIFMANLPQIFIGFSKFNKITLKKMKSN